MKQPAVRLGLLAATLLVAAHAQAATVVGPLQPSPSPFATHSAVIHRGPGLDQAPLQFIASDQVSVFLRATEASTAPVLPGRTDVETRRLSQTTDQALAFTAPVVAVGSTPVAAGSRLEGVQIKGGLTWATKNNGVTTKGGSLTLDSLYIDTQNHVVGGNLTGTRADGSASTFHEDVRIWNYAPDQSTLAMALTPSLVSSDPSIQTVNLSGKVAGLSLTSEARAIFSRSLGLMPLGLDTMDDVQNWGVITIPEPSSMLLMGLGMASLGAVVRKQPTRVG